MPNPTVAIVTPTHQRRHSLARVLGALSGQQCPLGFFEVVVVCDGCTDGTAQMLRETDYPFRLHVLEQFPSEGPAAARNRALTVGAAPIVLFLDDDVVPAEQLVAIHAARHSDQPNLVVMGPLLSASGRQQPWIRWEAETLAKQYAEMQAGVWTPTPRQFYTGNASVRRHHLLRIGGFDRRYRRGEDVELAFRLHSNGLQFVFEPEAAGVHLARRTFKSWVRAAHEYGRVESSMGPVWGTHGLVDSKAAELSGRHPLVRGIVSLGRTTPQLAPAMIGIGRIAARAMAGAGLWRPARGAYTALFELAYWRGVTEAAAIKKTIPEPPAPGIEAVIR